MELKVSSQKTEIAFDYYLLFYGVDLYNKKNFSNLKNSVYLNRKALILWFSYLLVSILFFAVWASLVLGIGMILAVGIIPIGLILPFYLLITVVKYKSKPSFLIVFGIFVFKLLIEINDLIKLNGFKQDQLNGLPIPYIECISCEIESSVQLIFISLIGIIILNTKIFRSHFKIEHRFFLMASSVAILIYFILFVLGLSNITRF